MSRRTSLANQIELAAEGRLSLDLSGSGWPSRGTMEVHGRRIPVHLYVGPIGDSHRMRQSERRFQNPGQDRPIRDVQGGVPLLFGVAQGDGSAEPVVVVFDAYRRLDLKTRFSMFLPAALIAEAASAGHAEHVSTTGEELVAFPISRIAEYLETLIEAPALPSMYSASAEASYTSTASDAGALHIRPKVGMYAAFARLNYRPWFALAEFVDNAIQSYLHHRAALGPEPLTVEIRLDGDEIQVRDRAGGIAWSDFPRAFSPSQPPPDATGLSEFGLGMKAAACWFANNWSVRTSALGDPVEREVQFDVERITANGIEHLTVDERPVSADDHYTVVTLSGLRVRPHGRTIGKIKSHLTSIYRVLMEKGIVEIRWVSAGKETILEYQRRPLLRAPYFRSPDGVPREWIKRFELELASGKSIAGWAALLEKGSVSKAGFSVFRRDRLIQGSDDETYRPLSIFRSPNSYTYQRLVGELHVSGFDVSHTKDGIQWDGLEQEMLQRLKAKLNDDDAPLLRQAEGYRVRQSAKELPQAFGAEALQGAGAELAQTPLSADLSSETSGSDDATLGTASSTELGDTQVRNLEEFSTAVRVGHETWTVNLKLIGEPSEDWYGVRVGQVSPPLLEVWINLAHPFSEAYVNGDENTLGPLVRLVAAMAISERLAIGSGLPEASTLRLRVNKILRTSFRADTQV